MQITFVRWKKYPSTEKLILDVEIVSGKSLLPFGKTEFPIEIHLNYPSGIEIIISHRLVSLFIGSKKVIVKYFDFSFSVNFQQLLDLMSFSEDGNIIYHCFGIVSHVLKIFSLVYSSLKKVSQRVLFSHSGIANEKISITFVLDDKRSFLVYYIFPIALEGNFHLRYSNHSENFRVSDHSKISIFLRKMEKIIYLQNEIISLSSSRDSEYQNFIFRNIILEKSLKISDK